MPFQTMTSNHSFESHSDHSGEEISTISSLSTTDFNQSLASNESESKRHRTRRYEKPPPMDIYKIIENEKKLKRRKKRSERKKHDRSKGEKERKKKEKR